VLIAAAWWTGEHEDLTWHYRIGMLALMLILFRLIWGVVGGSTARFARFVKGPAGDRRLPARYGPADSRPQSARRAQRTGIARPGGGGAVLGYSPPTMTGCSPARSRIWSATRRPTPRTSITSSASNLLLALVAVHVAAILYYWLFRARQLIGPMVTGSREGPEGAEPLRPAPAWRTVAAIVARLPDRLVGLERLLIDPEPARSPRFAISMTAAAVSASEPPK
jgi:hypothetical protein